MDRTHSFGYWVRRRRKALDLSQRELAERSACSLSAIKKIEQDTRRPSLQLAELLADSLAIREDERQLFLRAARGLAQVDQMRLSRQPLVASSGEERTAGLQSGGNLPEAMDPILGRDQEGQKLADLITSGQDRLITLIGPGGVGKSRLALEAARQTRGNFQDGAWFIPLAGIEDPAMLSSSIAVTLGLTFAGPLDPERQLIRLLEGRRLLLVLDNFEQLLPQGVELLITLIQNLPGISLLITSRERLRMQAELTMSLQGLPVESARRLFAARARRAGADMPTTPTPEESPIDGICQLVAGLPLAVELAAGWTRLLSPAEILADLEHNLDLLKGNLQDVPDRHRSMRAVFEASWARLPPNEQRLLACLSIFAGSFGRAAAESVCQAALAQLALLQDHSLLQRLESRFFLHELVRQFAAEKLAENPEDTAQARFLHARHYAGLLEKYSDLLRSGGPGLIGWQREIEAEMDNIRVGWKWAVTNHRPDLLLPAALSLGLYLDLRGQVREGAKMMAGLARSAERSQVDAGTDGGTLNRARALANAVQGMLDIRAGEATRGVALLSQAGEALQGQDAPIERMTALIMLAPSAMITRDYAAGRRMVKEGLRLAEESDHAWGRALALNFLGLLYLGEQKARRARDTFLQAISLWDEQPGLLYCKARSLVHLGLAHHALGEHRRAVDIQQEALRLAIETLDYSFVPLAHCNLAFHFYALDDMDGAETEFRTGLAEAMRYDLMGSALHAILGLGMVAASAGQSARAVTLLAFGSSRPGPGMGFLFGEPRRALSELRDGLPEDHFSAAEDRAQNMNLDELIAWLD